MLDSVCFSMRKVALFFIFVVFLGGLMICSCSKENGTTPSGPGGGAESAGGAAAGQDGSQMATPPMGFQLPPITDLHQLLATNGEAFWTRNVELSHVMVQRVLSDKQFILIGPDNSQTVPVQLNGSHPEIKEGREVDISGIIDPLGKDLSQWDVPPPERQALAGHTMFIRAVSIKPSGS